MPQDREPSTRRDANAAAFATLLAELDWWIRQRGSAAVPQSAVGRDVDGRPYPLGQRLHDKRKAHRAGRLDPDQARALERRPGWAWSQADRVSADAWSRHVQTLRAYAGQNGSLDGLESVHPAAASWLRLQRERDLSDPQRRELQAIPGALQQRRERIGDFVAALRDWVAQDPDRDAGALRWSTVHHVDGRAVPLGKRAAYVRARHDAGALTPDQVAALEAVPGWDWQTPRARAAAQAEGQLLEGREPVLNPPHTGWPG